MTAYEAVSFNREDSSPGEAISASCSTEQLRIGTPRAQWAEGRHPRRLTQLLLGCIAYGASVALLVRSEVGVMPWDVLHQGLARQTGLSLGTWAFLTGVAVVLLWIPLRQAPGVGTVANILILGVSADLFCAILPAAGGTSVGIAYLVAGVLLNGVATAAYVGVRLGPGPRDGLMTGLTVRTGLPVLGVRTAIEIVVVAVGWLLGGTVGVGTLVYALAIGPLVGKLLPVFTVRPRAAVSG